MWSIWRTLLEETDKLAKAKLAAVEIFQTQIADDVKVVRQNKLQLAKKVLPPYSPSYLWCCIAIRKKDYRNWTRMALNRIWTCWKSSKAKCRHVSPNWTNWRKSTSTTSTSATTLATRPAKPKKSITHYITSCKLCYKLYVIGWRRRRAAFFSPSPPYKRHRPRYVVARCPFRLL